MKKGHIITIIIVLVLLGVYALSSQSGDKQKSLDTENPIKIGVIEPLSGGAAAYGEVAKNGFSMAVDEINAAGGIDGKKIEIIFEDSKCNAKDALSATQKLVNTDKVEYLVGAMCSSEVLAALPVTEGKPMIFLGEGSSPEITGKGKYFFRTWPSDALSGKALADYVTPKYKKVAVITEKTEYAVALGKTFSESVTAQGGEIVAEETFSGDIKDFRALLSKIKRTNPEVLFINPQTGPAGAQIAKQARELGINAQFVAFFFTGDEFVKTSDAVNGTIILDVPSLNESRPLASSFASKYRAKYTSFNYPFVAGQTYDYIYLLKQAIEEAGNDPVKVKAYLNNMTKYEGVIGDFSFDQNGDVKGVGFSFKKIENNELVDLSI